MLLCGCLATVFLSQEYLNKMSTATKTYICKPPLVTYQKLSHYYCINNQYITNVPFTLSQTYKYPLLSNAIPFGALNMPVLLPLPPKECTN